MMTKTKAQAPAKTRIDVVFIRKSSKGQNEEGQINNVRTMLREQGKYIADRHWFTGVVSRRKLKGNDEFQSLMSLVENDQIGTVYIETQDRWGTSDRKELFTLLGVLAEHKTRLYDLRAKKDLTRSDHTTELLAMLGSFKSEKELQDLSYRSLRSRVARLKEAGSWPGGTQPFGYDKACFSADGKLLWVWHPVQDRWTGQQFFVKDDQLQPGPEGIHIPRKAKLEIMLLAPSMNRADQETVKDIFRWYVSEAVSRRQLAYRLNSMGRTIYGQPFTHFTVGSILRNPAYAGDTVFGKLQTGELNQFDKEGMVNPVEAFDGKKARKPEDCLIKRDTHDGLVDRPTFDDAQKKLAREDTRTNFPARNPAYYLKGIFYCGHCKKPLTGRSYKNPSTGQMTRCYVCLSYVRGQASGVETKCGYHAITHEDAEALLMRKLEELGRAIDGTDSTADRLKLEARLQLLGTAYDDERALYLEMLTQGIDSYLALIQERFPRTMDHSDNFKKLFNLADRLLEGRQLFDRDFEDLPLSLGQFKELIEDCEAESVRLAKVSLAGVQKEHRALTLAWAKASDLQQPILKEELERLEEQLRYWQGLTVPLWERLAGVDQAVSARLEEMKDIRTELPTMEDRQKGEALRRAFSRVTLTWEKTWHPANNPRRKGSFKGHGKAGRFSYRLQEEAIRWEFPSSNLEGSCCKGTCSRSGR